MSAEELLSKKKNPFFLHSEADNFLAIKEGKVVGRISAIKNDNYNKFHGSNIGFWGFYDVFDDYEVSRALLDKVIQWNKSQNFTSVIGPVNYSTNDTAGLLIEGFDSPPLMDMTYNKKYYQAHLEKYGFVKEMDLYAYMIYTAKVSDKSIKLAKLITERLKKKGITIRKINMKDFTNEVLKIKDVYNKAWEKNWGFVPATEEEFMVLAKNFKMIANPDIVLIAEHEGKFIGFSLAVPNINEITINFKKGKLFPFNIFKLLLNKHKTKYARIVTLGVIDGYRNLGIEAAFYSHFIEFARKKGLVGGEASWILENNEKMRLAAQNLNGEIYKTYRLYSKSL
jgi:GNAT superfamily N-acetyltransferase